MVQYVSKKKLQIDLSSRLSARARGDCTAERSRELDCSFSRCAIKECRLILPLQRKQADVGKVIEGWTEAVLSQIVEVSIDLSGNYKGLMNKLLPNAEVVADRFQVMKIVGHDLDTARNTVRTNGENLNKVEKSRIESLPLNRAICFALARGQFD